MKEMTAWERVKIARHQKRPTAKDLISYLVSDFVELKGDRNFRDDPSIIAGIGTFKGIPMTIIAQEKGSNTEEKIKHNFGMAHPEGYRKALRLMRQAEKFHRPILCIIDTPGAYPGIGAEERGQAQAIAFNLREMMSIKTPIICVVLGEGGSGGALAIGVGDYIMMFENSIYAILSPEGYASIIYKDASKASDAAELMKLTSYDLKRFGIIDEIVDEQDGLHENPDFGFQQFAEALQNVLRKLMKMPVQKRLEQRYMKFRQIGIYNEGVESNHESTTD
jgi:acetyl-CoA carboxylase carboxyl transferase subunit alpha